MGKTHSKPLAARHGRGTAWAWHGNDMLCVNRPSESEQLDHSPCRTALANSALVTVLLGLVRFSTHVLLRFFMSGELLTSR